MAGRASIRLSVANVGHRVVIRRRLPDGRFGDLLGDLLAWPDETGDHAAARIRTPHDEVEVRLSDIVAGKRIPPPPPRRKKRRP
ncbi:MAG: hypothetical protein ACRCTR_05525 [Actinomycetota bacterium]